MRRRSYLALLGTAMAGCTGDAGESTPTRTPRDTPTSEPGTTRTPELDVPEGYYDGPMISAHEHLNFMPDEEIDWYLEWMDRNRIAATVAFSVPEQLALYEAAPDRIIPFNQEPHVDHVLPVVAGEGANLPAFLDVPDERTALEEFPALYRESLRTTSAWQGIGEIAPYLYRNAEGWPPLPDADWLMELYRVAAEFDVTLMLHPPHPGQFEFHPWDGDPLETPIMQGLRRAFRENPETDFLVHGFRQTQLEAVNPLLEAFDNWWYDVSGVMNGHPGPPPFWTRPFQDDAEQQQARRDVVEHMTDDHIEEHVESQFDVWEPILTSHPDRVLWGIDTGRQWHFNPDFLDINVRFYRGVLGRLPADAARKIAHENARRLWL